MVLEWYRGVRALIYRRMTLAENQRSSRFTSAGNLGPVMLASLVYYRERVALSCTVTISKCNVFLVRSMLDHEMASARGKDSVPTSSALPDSSFSFNKSTNTLIDLFYMCSEHSYTLYGYPRVFSLSQTSNSRIFGKHLALRQALPASSSKSPHAAPWPHQQYPRNIFLCYIELSRTSQYVMSLQEHCRRWPYTDMDMLLPSTSSGLFQSGWCCRHKYL